MGSGRELGRCDRVWRWWGENAIDQFDEMRASVHVVPYACSVSFPVDVLERCQGPVVAFSKVGA